MFFVPIIDMVPTRKNILYTPHSIGGGNAPETLVAKRTPKKKKKPGSHPRVLDRSTLYQKTIKNIFLEESAHWISK